MEIGKTIKALRTQKRVTQEQAAAHLGVSCQAVSKWETRASLPDVTLLPAIAAYFGVTIDELLAQYDHYLAAEYAKRALELAPEEKPGWVAYLEAMGGVCGDEWYDNHFEVIEYFKRFVEKNPANYRGYYALIENLLADGRYDEAEPYIHAMQKIKDDYQAITYLGDVALGRGDRDGALRLWDEAVEKSPDAWQAWCGRADRIKKLGMWDQAEADYEKCFAMQAPPRLTDGLYSLAQMHEQKKDWAAAIRDYNDHR